MVNNDEQNDTYAQLNPLNASITASVNDDEDDDEYSGIIQSQPVRQQQQQEHESSPRRIGNLDDLRTRKRETLTKNRVQRKCVKLILNRKSLADSLNLSPPRPNSEYSNCASSSSYEDPEDQYVDDPNYDDSASAQIWMPCFLQDKSRKSYNTSPNLHKRAAFSQESLAEQVKCLKSSILEQSDGQSELQNHLIQRHWPLISVGLEMDDSEIANQFLDILISFANYEPQTIIYLLQNGLLNCLRKCIVGEPISLRTKGISLLIHICMIAPGAIPYLVDLLHSLGMLKNFNDLFFNAELTTVHILSRFYYVVTNYLIEQICNNFQEAPLMPDILAATGSSTTQTMHSYSPQQTFEKLVGPIVILGLVSQCVTKYNRRHDESINASLLILANVLKACHSSTNLNWVLEIGRAFKDSNLNINVAQLCRALHRHNRNAENSEHSSQGLPEATSASKSMLERCGKFMSFFNQYYAPIKDLVESSDPSTN